MLLSLFGEMLASFTDPVLAGLYDALQGFLLALVHERTDPLALPGIAAMLPTSPLIAMLNMPSLRNHSDLCVIAGNAQGKDFLGKLRLFIPDKFYGGTHDLVVNCASMDGGVPRHSQRLFSDSGPGVNHFSYFSNPVTRQAMLDGLTRLPDAVDGFQSFNWQPAEIPSRSLPAGGPRPVVYVIPGVFGTHIGDVWLRYEALVRGGLRKLRGEPAALVGVFYDKLLTFLQATHEVVAFPYDWRVTLRHEADRLSTTLSRRERVRVVAHSTGGLVVRLMLATRPELRHKIERLILLGTPSGGSYEVARMLAGKARLTRQLTMLDPLLDARAVLRSLPGLLELLPRELMATGSEAEATRNILDTPWEVPVIYVAGLAADTPVAQENLATAEGDGFTSWAAGIPAGAAAYYSIARHGDLANYEPDFPALGELLERGVTARLPRQPPAVARELHAMEPEWDEVRPSERDLAAAALGAALTPPVRQEQRMQVEVVHGNLAFARHCVAVGHYAGDSIVGAEAALDQYLEGRLSSHNQFGVYPDRIGTAEVYLRADKSCRPSGGDCRRPW